MTERPFEPSSVTKPIQLLAAWLIGLILINGSFLTAARFISRPDWAAGFLVICAAASVPLFLGALFLLQTKFRPEMQEDSFYYRYLERRFSLETNTEEVIEVKADPSKEMVPFKRVSTVSLQKPSELSGTSVEVNDLLPDYEKIAEELSQNGIKIDKTFGTISYGKPAPEKFILSVGRGVVVNIYQSVLQVIQKYNLTGVTLSPEYMSQGRIFVGSYIYEQDRQIIHPFTPKIKRLLLADNLTVERLEEILLRGA